MTDVMSLQTNAMDLLKRIMGELVGEIKEHRNDMKHLREEMSEMRQELQCLKQEKSSLLNQPAAVTVDSKKSEMPASPVSVTNPPEGGDEPKAKKEPRQGGPLGSRKRQTSVKKSTRVENQPVASKSPPQQKEKASFSQTATVKYDSPNRTQNSKSNSRRVKSMISPQKAGKMNVLKKELVIAPYTAAELMDSQRRDKVLRNFMRYKTGLYDAKYMSIQEVDGQQLFCFKKKAYIPARLRKRTIQHYKTQYSQDAALFAMRANCIWPDMETEFSNAASTSKSTSSPTLVDKEGDSESQKPKAGSPQLSKPKARMRRRGSCVV